jgi:hypothetical protein
MSLFLILRRSLKENNDQVILLTWSIHMPGPFDFLTYAVLDYTLLRKFLQIRKSYHCSSVIAENSIYRRSVRVFSHQYYQQQKKKGGSLMHPAGLKNTSPRWILLLISTSLLASYIEQFWSYIENSFDLL